MSATPSSQPVPTGASTNTLMTQADTVGRLAQDAGGFAAVVAAFESRDPDAFRWVLQRLELLPHCEVICEWVRIKLCVLRCLEVCGPPGENAEIPSLQEYASAVVKLASNEKLLRRAVDTVSCGDAEGYRAVLAELDLDAFCHLLCHWVCSITYQRICEVVCSPQSAPILDSVDELRDAGKVVAVLLANRKAFNAASSAAAVLDCETLKSAISEVGISQGTGGCEIICRWICSWRCAWVCRELCRLPAPIPTSGIYAVEEARSFALAARQLAGQPRVLGDLINAVQRRDAGAYGEIIGRFGLGPYCLQVCAWVCSVVCHEFCICVCPSQALEPWFTTVGYFGIYSDIDAASGTTNKSLPFSTLSYGGGPNFAFFNKLQLGGFCPAYQPLSSPSPSTQMKYRFLYASVKTTLAAAINAAQTSIPVASSAGVPATPFNVSVCSGETSETMTVAGVSGTTWTVSRGATASAFAAGATLWISPLPITGALVSPVEAGTRIINWPQNVGGFAGAALVSTFQPVIIASAPTPPDPTPPAPGAPWVGPSAHYIQPDISTGWVAVDPNAVGGGFATLLGFDTTQAVPGGCPLPSPGLCFGTPGGTPAGSAVPAASQGAGTDLTIIFEAAEVGAATAQYSNSLCKIHVNNWAEVNNLWLVEFGTDSCCNPIDATLSVQFTVDHEEMNSGAWTLSIDGCATTPPAPGVITPVNPTPGVTFTAAGRGAWGTIVEDTTKWQNCSYQVWLNTRPGLTDGINDRDFEENLLTFCICGH